MLPQETRCFDCLAELYGMLNEDDVLFGLWKRRGAALETRAALSCIQHGMLVRGQDFLEEAINKNQAGAYQAAGEHCSTFWQNPILAVWRENGARRPALLVVGMLVNLKASP